MGEELKDIVFRGEVVQRQIMGDSRNFFGNGSVGRLGSCPIEMFY